MSLHPQLVIMYRINGSKWVHVYLILSVPSQCDLLLESTHVVVPVRLWWCSFSNDIRYLLFERLTSCDLLDHSAKFWTDCSQEILHVDSCIKLDMALKSARETSSVPADSFSVCALVLFLYNVIMTPLKREWLQCGSWECLGLGSSLTITSTHVLESLNHLLVDSLQLLLAESPFTSKTLVR